jgi:hypothetical protein
MSLLLLFRPEPVVPHGPENPDVELDTFLVSMNSPEAHVDAPGLTVDIDGSDPTTTLDADPPTSVIVVV